MPREKKRARSVAEAEAQHLPLSTPTVTLDTYQLVVVNSCLTNEDIRLPCSPTPALLSAFYEQCNGDEERAAIASATAPVGLTSWKTEHWLRRVAHVPLGRHSALPPSFRLRHECVSRLHARVVYVQTPAMHKRFSKYFPCIEREDATARCAEKEEKRCEDERDVDVIVVNSDDESSTATPPPPPSASTFTSPYYLMVNYSENPVYVGRDCVSRGRSVRLQEGDVVSFLECAFDVDGGVLDGCVPKPASTTSDSATAVMTAHDTLTEPTGQLADASLQQFAATPPPARPVFPLCAQHRLIAQRRLYEVPSVIQEYVRWWSAQSRSAAESSPISSSHWLVSVNHLVRISSMTRSAAAASAAPELPTWSATHGNDGEDADDGSSPMPVSATRDRNASAVNEPALLFRTNALLNPAVAASLRQWLNDMEDLAEVADDAQSPLAARLTLDRAWLRSAVRKHFPRSSPQSEGSHSTDAAPSLSSVKAEDQNAGCATPRSPISVVKAEWCDGEVKQEEADVAESFRVSLSPLHGPTTPRESSCVQTALEELRHNCNGRKTTSAPLPSLEAEVGREQASRKVLPSHVAGEAPVRRSLHLDEDLITLFADTSSRAVGLEEARVHHGSMAREGSRRNSLACDSSALVECPSRTAGHATTVPGVYVETAVLPVYVFTRRSRSPEAYTREGASLRPFSPTTRDKATAAAANAAQYVYYFDPEESQSRSDAPAPWQKNHGKNARGNSAPDSASPVVATAQSAVVQQTEAKVPQHPSDSVDIADGGGSGAARFEWIDESEQKETARKRMKRKHRKRC